MKQTLNKLSKANKLLQAKTMEENMQPKNRKKSKISRNSNKISFRKSIIILSVLGMELGAIANSNQTSPSKSSNATTSTLSSIVNSSANTVNNTPQKKHAFADIKLTANMVPNLPFANALASNGGSENVPLSLYGHNNAQDNNMQNLFNAADDEYEIIVMSDDESDDEQLIRKTNQEIESYSIPAHNNSYLNDNDSPNNSMQKARTISLLSTPGTVSKPRQRYDYAHTPNTHTPNSIVREALNFSRRAQLNDEFSGESTPEKQTNQYMPNVSTPDNNSWSANARFRPSAAAATSQEENNWQQGALQQNTWQENASRSPVASKISASQRSNVYDSASKQTIQASFKGDEPETPENQLALNDYTPNNALNRSEPSTREGNNSMLDSISNRVFISLQGNNEEEESVTLDNFLALTRHYRANNQQNANESDVNNTENSSDGEIYRAIATSFDIPVQHPTSAQEMTNLINNQSEDMAENAYRKLFDSDQAANENGRDSVDNEMYRAAATSFEDQNHYTNSEQETVSSINSQSADTANSSINLFNNNEISAFVPAPSAVTANMDDFNYAGFFGDVIENHTEANVNTNSDISNHDADDDMPTGNMSNLVRYDNSNLDQLEQGNDLTNDINENDTYSERDDQTATQPTAVLNHTPNSNNEFANTDASSMKKNVRADKSDIKTDLSIE